MTVTAFLYDAEGNDQSIELAEFSIDSIASEQLLWIDVTGDDQASFLMIADKLRLDSALMRRINRPVHSRLDNYDDYFAFRVQTPAIAEDEATNVASAKAATLGFIVANRWLLTFHKSDIHLLKAFQAQDRGETAIGMLSPSLLTISLLDWYLAEFFTAASQIDARVDGIDEQILAEGADRAVLNKIVAARRDVSALRALISNQRPIFHGFTRPDFSLNADEAATRAFAALADRYDRAVDEVEHTREVVIGSFGLFTSMSSEETNDLVKGLTFVTVVIGFSAAVAGLLGMNFEAPFFKTGMTGFLVATGALVGISVLSIIVARLRRWI